MGVQAWYRTLTSSLSLTHFLHISGSLGSMSISGTCTQGARQACRGSLDESGIGKAGRVTTRQQCGAPMPRLLRNVHMVHTRGVVTYTSFSSRMLPSLAVVGCANHIHHARTCVTHGTV